MDTLPFLLPPSEYLAAVTVLANSLYIMGIDVGQGMAPLITAGVVIQYGLEYSFMLSAAILVTATLLIIWLNTHKSPSHARDES